MVRGLQHHCSAWLDHIQCSCEPRRCSGGVYYDVKSASKLIKRLAFYRRSSGAKTLRHLKLFLMFSKNGYCAICIIQDQHDQLCKFSIADKSHIVRAVDINLL